jgi:hypothetical protein
MFLHIWSIAKAKLYYLTSQIKRLLAVLFSAEVTDHASFIDDNDPLESPELAAVLEEVECKFFSI